MKAGDLIRDKQWPNDGYGVIAKVIDRRRKEPYLVLCANGKLEWLPKEYIEKGCEIISET